MYLGALTMRRRPITNRSHALGEATVQATKIKFYTKNDTLIYNADAFQLQEGSMLDALIAQLPGAELKPDGRIMVQGRFVESLLLNGRDFFKGDNTVLLDNLPAYMVQQVQVYEKESELSKLVGKKMDEGMYVMDVKLKRQYSIGWLANTEWGGGTRERYLGRLFAMRYTPQSRLTFFGNLNNVNDRRKPDGNGGWGDVDPSGGLSAGKRAGMDYGIYDKRDRYELSGDIDVNYTDNDNMWSGTSTNFLAGGDTHDVTAYGSRSNNLNVSTSHRFKFRGLSQGSTTGMSFSPRFNYHNRDYRTELRAGTFSTPPPDEDYMAVIDSLFTPSWTSAVRNLIKRVGQDGEGHGRGTNGGLDFWGYWGMPYSRDGVTVEAGVSYSDNDNTNFNHYIRNFYENNLLQNDARNRYRSQPSRTFGYNVMGKYIWHWTSEIMLNPSYEFAYNYSSSDQLHYRLDVLEGSDDQPLGWLPSQAEALLEALDRDNSYWGTQHRYTHTVTLDWQWNRYEKTPEGKRHAAWRAQIRPNVRFQKTDFSFRSSPEDQQVKKYYALPYLKLWLRRNTPGYRHEMTLDATIQTSAPSMTNLVDKTFAADPLNITLGNPNLKQTADFHVDFNYRADKWLQSKERQLYGNVAYHYTHNATAMRYTYDRATGVTTNQPVNVDGNWGAWLNVGFTTPLDRKRRFTLSTNTSNSFSHSVDYASSQADVDPRRTTTRSYYVDETLRINYRYNKVSVGLTGAVGYNHAVADRDDFNDVNTWNVRSGVNAVVDLPWELQLSTDLMVYTRRGYDNDEMNRSDLVWNARLSKRVWKNRLTFMVDAWDILGNLSSTSTGVDSRSRWAYYYNIIPRYVMLRAVYRLDLQPKKNRQ